MKYQPALPEHNDNVSHQQPVKEFFILLTGVLVIGYIGYWALGLFVDVAVDYLSPEQEAELFASVNFDWELGKESMPEEQATLQAYLEELQPCLSLPYPITVSLVTPESEDDDIVNAVALPGGKIVIFSKLLETVSSKNGLMFVLAHELGHFKNRDHLRHMGRGIIIVILSMLAFGNDIGMSEVLTNTINLHTATYSQSRESQADLTALQALQCHFGHVGGATELFESLHDLSAESDDFGLSHYFSTHPEIQQRIDDIHRLTQELQFSTDTPEPLDL